jgi:hypothetical protein
MDDELEFSQEIVSADYIREHAFLQIINAEQNQDMLLEVPYRPVPGMDDLVAIPRVRVIADNGIVGSYKVTNNILMRAGLTSADIFSAAAENGERLFPAIVKPLNEHMRDMIDERSVLGQEMLEVMDAMPPSPIWVVGNQQGAFGAASILYKDMPRKVSRILQEDYYILPSSVHELLIVGTSEAYDPEELQAIVKDVNATIVKEDEKLSDNIYLYDAERDEILTIDGGQEKGQDLEH